MSLIIYSLDNEIKTFFDDHPPLTQQKCDEFAESLVGAPVNPAPIQGSFSYTVIAGADQSKVIQFRSPKSLLDLSVLDLARRIYGHIVAANVDHGEIDQTSRVTVYVAEKHVGETYIEACLASSQMSPEVDLRQSNTAVDFARFFAASWKGRQICPLLFDEGMYLDHERKLDLLSRGLPARFAKSLSEVRLQLSLLYAPTYPVVLSHDDLCPTNVLVNTEGHVTGIVDWADAKMLPFGMNLWGFENILGWMNSEGWHYYDNHRKLEGLFWRIFDELVGEISTEHRETIRVARTVGIFLRYGYFDLDKEIVVKESNPSIRYLDAFCLSGEKFAA